VTETFLQHSKMMGNDLTTPRPDFAFPGLKPGDRWCVCAGRWLELLERDISAPVVLASTHERTLEVVPLELLQQHATS